MTQVLEIERQPLGNGFVEWWRLNSPQTRNALTDEHGSAREKAEYWSSFLKPRIETLEYQSVLRAGFAAYSAAAMAFIALMLNAFEQPVAAGAAAGLPCR